MATLKSSPSHRIEGSREIRVGQCHHLVGLPLNLPLEGNSKELVEAANLAKKQFLHFFDQTLRFVHVDDSRSQEQLVYALGLLVYQLSSFAVRFGLPLEDAFSRIHEDLTSCHIKE